MLIRSMGPQVIAVDEIGTPEDVHAIEYAMHCGCKMLATVHAESMEELRKKPLFNRMIGEGRFERYILLGNNVHVGQIEGIFDNRGRVFFTKKQWKWRNDKGNRSSHGDSCGQRLGDAAGGEN